MIKPNFFIIGAPKCGTTSLSEYLRTHPNIFISKPKEPHYFSFDFRNKGWTLEKYLSLFSNADPKLHKIVGEASTDYFFSKVAVPEIMKFNPDSKFVVMLRNPIEMVQALHSERILEGLENIPEFEQAWRAENDRKRGEKIPFTCPNPEEIFYSEWAKYGVLLERLLSSTPRKNLLIIIFDDFINDPKQTYINVLKFLELPNDSRNEFPKFQENKKVNRIWLQQALRLFGYFFSDIKRVLGIKYNFGLIKGLTTRNIKSSKRNSISNEFRSELIDFYKADIGKLSKLLARDLTFWIG